MRVMIENNYLFEEFIEILPDVTSENAKEFEEETKQFFTVLKTKHFGLGPMGKLYRGNELSPTAA